VQPAGNPVLGAQPNAKGFYDNMSPGGVAECVRAPPGAMSPVLGHRHRHHRYDCVARPGRHAQRAGRHVVVETLGVGLSTQHRIAAGCTTLPCSGAFPKDAQELT